MAMMIDDGWKKSSVASTHGTSIQARRTENGVSIRHSHKPESTITIDPAAWVAFLTGAKSGEFDL